MTRSNQSIRTAIVVALLSLVCGQLRTEDGELLWQIGKADDDTADLALGRNGYARFERDGFFIVGHSDPRVDWPYTHPGPDDFWAGGQPHTFTILFGLAAAPSADASLVVDLVDTHNRAPPELRFDINGTVSTHRTPKGGADDSIMGDPKSGREHRFTMTVPPKALKAGVNEITITNAAGSWILYDWLGLEAPSGAELKMSPATQLRSVRVDPWLSRQDGKLSQRLVVELLHLGDPAAAVLRASGAAPVELALKCGRRRVELRLPGVDAATAQTIALERGGVVLGSKVVMRGPATVRQPADYVDPLLGTSTSRWMLYPGPSVPFSMVKLSPDNQRQCWKAGYEYTIHNIAGFSHLHSWTMGGLLTMPTTGELKTVPGPENDPDAGYRSRFRHELEFASPGYYEVTLDDYDIRAQLTATTRAGMQRYTFPTARHARILFDLLTPTEYGYTVLDARIAKVGNDRLEGYSRQRSGRYASYNEFTLHFVARLSKPFASFGGWVGEEVKRNVQEVTGKGDVGAFIEYSTSKGDSILLQTGISLVSIEQARLNLETELVKPYGWDFDTVRKDAWKTWNKLLSTVEVEGGSEDQKVKFYTNMYRSYCARTIWSDVNGKYVDMYEKVQQLEDPHSPIYGCDAFWNTFWNLNQLWGLVTPDITAKWVRSLLEIYDRGGWLPKGPTGIEYSSIMVASHEIALIVAAYQQGIRNFDIDKAYEAVRHIQMEPGRPHEGGGHVGNRQLASYMKYGYVPVEKGPVSNTLEYAYDDWCVAQFAKALGKKKDYERFMERSANYKNVFDPEVGYMRQKHADGRWVKDFSPFNSRGFVEGNSWQFTWFVPHDVQGLIALLGKEEFNRRLEKGLRDSAASDFNATHDRFADFPINHGNQPNMQSAWLFNHSGAPWLTQKWVREILERYYGLGPIDGWPGDEDQGQMGAWYVMSAMGLFQMDGGCAVRPIYELGSPIFDRITIHLDQKYYQGRTFVIETINNSPTNMYIQSATLDGKPLNRPWFYHSQLTDGGTLVLRLGPEPNTEWGSVPEDAPPQNP